MFDEQFKFVSGSFEQVGNAGDFLTHQRNGLPVTKNGYLYIYLSKETTNINVFFDNLQVTHIKGPLLEETHYYQFGLTMSGISSKAAGTLTNKKKFNAGSELQNEEFSDGSGLEWYDVDARFYDPQLGRFMQVDPEPDEGDQEPFQPYQYALDNPITNNDPDGKIWNNIVGGIVGGLVEIGSQVITNAVTGKELTKISWGQVGIAAAEGFVTSGGSVARKIVAKGVAALASSTVDYLESNKINSLKDVGNIAKNAVIGVAADATTGAVAKLAKGVGGKALQNASNKIVGSKNQITKNILANNAVSTKTAIEVAKTVQPAQKAVAKVVRETNVKAAETITKGAANSGVTKVKDITNL